jgi:hypothetical protein
VWGGVGVVGLQRWRRREGGVGGGGRRGEGAGKVEEGLLARVDPAERHGGGGGRWGSLLPSSWKKILWGRLTASLLRPLLRFRHVIFLHTSQSSLIPQSVRILYLAQKEK